MKPTDLPTQEIYTLKQADYDYHDSPMVYEAAFVHI